MLTPNEISLTVGDSFNVHVQTLNQELNSVTGYSANLVLRNAATDYDIIGPMPKNLVTLIANPPVIKGDVMFFQDNRVKSCYIKFG